MSLEYKKGKKFSLHIRIFRLVIKLRYYSIIDLGRYSFLRTKILIRLLNESYTAFQSVYCIYCITNPSRWQFQHSLISQRLQMMYVYLLDIRCWRQLLTNPIAAPD